MPRARSAWLAAYFTTNESICFHEKLSEGDEEFNRALNTEYKYTGFSDTSICLRPDLITGKCVVIHRDLKEVINSLMKFTILTDEIINELKKAESRLSAIKGLHINYHEIDNRLEEIHNYLLPGTYNSKRAEIFKQMNIQTTQERNKQILGDLCLDI